MGGCVVENLVHHLDPFWWNKRVFASQIPKYDQILFCQSNQTEYAQRENSAIT
jgi:hypothetical protein